MIKVTAIKCSKCKDVIYSRARHDMRYCTCKTIFIDGGRDYTRVGCDPEIKVEGLETHELEVDATDGDLFYDWNMRENRFGLVKEKSK
jgi:hypothetical protein